MKQSMKIPTFGQLYFNKHNYDQHRRKLKQIMDSRKTNLTFNGARINHFESLKQTKFTAFRNKINNRHNDITRENLKLLDRLDNAKSSVKRSISETSRTEASVESPFVKKRNREVEKQNGRICDKMANMNSSLNHNRFRRQFERTQTIKNRIMRFASKQNKVYLKSEVFFSSNDNRSFGKNSRKKQKKKSAASFYRREDIQKNKIQGNLLRRKSNQFRATSSFSGKNRSGQFFPTEPDHQKRYQRRVRNG